MEKVWNLEKEELMEVDGMGQNDHLTQRFQKQAESAKKMKREEFEKRESCNWNFRKRNVRWSKTHGFTRKATVKKHVKDRKVKVIRRKKAVKEQWGGEWCLPVPALEKIFSNLGWKDLGRAMLVCRRWQEVGGHPSLWAEFSLQLDPGTFQPKIRRLDWVKSATICLSGAVFESFAGIIQVAIDTWPRLEELFIFCDKMPLLQTNDQILSILKFLKTDSNKLLRIGTRLSYSRFSEYHCIYYVSSCDTDSSTFLKRTLKCDKDELGYDISLFGLPGDYLSNLILETVCTFGGIGAVFTTNLMIDQKMDLRKLIRLLNDNVDYRTIHFNWDLQSEDSENQEVAPVVNTILELLAGGGFLSFEVPKKLLLQSDWVGRLGGRGKVESSKYQKVLVEKTEMGLKMNDDNEDDSEEGSEEGSEDGSEDEDMEEEEDFEEEDESLEQVRPPGTPNPDDLDTTDDQISQRSEKE